MNEFLNNDFLYGMIVCRLSQRSTLVFMLKDLQRQGHFTAVRVSKDKAVAVFAANGREVTFRFRRSSILSES